MNVTCFVCKYVFSACFLSIFMFCLPVRTDRNQNQNQKHNRQAELKRTRHSAASVLHRSNPGCDVGLTLCLVFGRGEEGADCLAPVDEKEKHAASSSRR